MGSKGRHARRRRKSLPPFHWRIVGSDGLLWGSTFKDKATAARAAHGYDRDHPATAPNRIAQFVMVGDWEIPQGEEA